MVSRYAFKKNHATLISDEFPLLKNGWVGQLKYVSVYPKIVYTILEIMKYIEISITQTTFSLKQTTNF